MTEKLQPELMLAQLETLGELHKGDFKRMDEGIREAFIALELESLHRLYLVGDGDSYYAGLAAKLAFESLGGLPAYPLPAFEFLNYGAEHIPCSFPRDTLVLGISASGRSPMVVDAIQKAQQVSEMIQTAALVGTVDSPLAEAAGRVVDVEVPDLGRTPGIRTYTASLLGLLNLAIRIGEIKRAYTMDAANAMRQEITDLAEAVTATYRAVIEPAQAAAEALQSADMMLFAGSGPSFGSAQFSAAKVIESAGIFTHVTDLEEWSHVGRFSYPLDHPVFLVAPAGKSYPRALKLAQDAKALGHPLLAVVDADETEISALADFVFPLQARVREAFSPLLTYLAATAFAAYLAKGRGRCLFMTDNPTVTELEV